MIPSRAAILAATALASSAFVAAAPINPLSFLSSSWKDAAGSPGSSSDPSSSKASSGSSSNAPTPPVSGTSLSQKDQQILNLLLTAENLEANLYREGLQKFSNPSDYDAQFPVVKGHGLFDILTLLGAQENDHRILIEEALKKTDSQALLGDDLLVNANEFDFSSKLGSVEDWVAAITQIEGGGTSGYLTALGAFDDPNLRSAAAAIATVEARHNAFLRFLFSLSPSPNSEDASITPSDVLTLIGGLINPTLLGEMAFKPHTGLTASTSNATVGETISFTGLDTQGATAYCGFLSQVVPKFAPLSGSSCQIPQSVFLGGQTYVAILKSQSFSDDQIIAGPTIIELGDEVPFAKFPIEFTSSGSALNAQGDEANGILAAQGTLSQGDRDIVNILLTAENLEANFYNEGLKKYTTDDDYKQAFGLSGVLKIIKQFGAQENDHRVELNKVLNQYGAPAVLQDVDNSAKFNFGAALDSIQSFISTIEQIEGGGTSGYLGAVTKGLENPTVRQAAAQIMSIEARHNTFLRFLNKKGPSAGDEDATITPADVLTLVGGFVADPSLAAALAFKPHKSLNVTSTSFKQGSPVTFAGVETSSKAFCGFLSQLDPQFADFDSSKQSCTIPTSSQLSGQTYVAILSAQNFTDDAIIAGPAIIELGNETPVGKFP